MRDDDGAGAQLPLKGGPDPQIRLPAEVDRHDRRRGEVHRHDILLPEFHEMRTGARTTRRSGLSGGVVRVPSTSECAWRDHSRFLCVWAQAASGRFWD